MSQDKSSLIADIVVAYLLSSDERKKLILETVKSSMEDDKQSHEEVLDCPEPSA